MIDALMFHAGTSSLFKDSVNPSKAFAGQDANCSGWRLKETRTKLSSAIKRKAGYCTVSPSGADVENVLVLVGRAILSEELDGLG